MEYKLDETTKLVITQSHVRLDFMQNGRRFYKIWEIPKFKDFLLRHLQIKSKNEQGKGTTE